MKYRLRKLGKILGIVLLMMLGILVVLSLIGNVVHATGLIDETVDSANMYSKYPLSNYQLDFYVDNSWAWLPWNWKDGIGKNIMYGIYAITNVIWWLSLQISNVTGYIVQEAFNLDFISDAASSIGKNIQILAGVSKSGFSSEGFYPGFLLIFILFLGIYVAYTGVIKRETSKAIQAVINFLLVFIISASFIAYAPDYIAKINEFSKDISTSALSLGTKITMPDSDVQGQDSVDLIRDTLFSIQVRKPWLLLQFGTTDIDEIGEDRVNNLLEVSPDDNDGEDREDIVKSEINDEDNANMSVTKVLPRLGTVAFLLLFNIGISIFVFLLTGNMIFSQILFLIFAMFLPISFLLSMLPSYNHLARRAVEKLFNTIMLRAGITLLITVAFSLSSMCYSLTDSYPLFLVMFLQIIVFFGIYSKMGDILGMFSLQSDGGQNVTRKAGRMLSSIIVGRTVGSLAMRNNKKDKKDKSEKTAHPDMGSGTNNVTGADSERHSSTKGGENNKSQTEQHRNSNHSRNKPENEKRDDQSRSKSESEARVDQSKNNLESGKKFDQGRNKPENGTNTVQNRNKSESNPNTRRHSTANKEQSQEEMDVKRQRQDKMNDDLYGRNKTRKPLVRADINSQDTDGVVTPSFGRREKVNTTTDHNDGVNSRQIGRQSTAVTSSKNKKNLNTSFTQQELRREKQTSFTQQELKREKQSQLKDQKKKGREK